MFAGHGWLWIEIGFCCRISSHMTSHERPPTMTHEPLADPVAVAAMRLGICRAKTYLEIAAGRLTAKKAGRRTLILRTEQERWLSALPVKGTAA